jgi:hypothetical protein
MHILSRLLAGEGYERVVRAVGVDTWHEIVDNYSALPTWRSTVVCQWKVAIGMAILEHEDMERRLRTLERPTTLSGRKFLPGEASEDAGIPLSTKRCRCDMRRRSWSAARAPIAGLEKGGRSCTLSRARVRATMRRRCPLST